jgi:hypothetical protein
MNVQYNYKPYKSPKKAIYFQSGNEYIFDKKTGYFGWSKILCEAIVIGETYDCYITRIYKSKVCDTTQSDYGKDILMPSGFHKSRLIEFLSVSGEQLILNI